MTPTAFLARLAFFLLPIVAFLALPSAVVVRSRELLALDVDAVIARQPRGSRVLYGPAYSECTKRYKLHAALALRPRVMVLGTSRSMQFRSEFFAPAARMYNAGGGASRIGHFREFLARLPAGAEPEVLIVSLDQWFFNRGTEQHAEAPFALQVEACSNTLNLFQTSWTQVYAGVRQRRIPLDSLLFRPVGEDVGLSALVDENGFRPDGSFLYGRIRRAPTDADANPDTAFRQSFARIRAGSQRFEYGDHVDAELVADLGRVLDAAARRHIHVVGFIPPYAPTVLDAMAATGRYGFHREIDAAVRPLFQARQMSVFDFADLRSLGSTDAEFVDGIHAGERAHVRMLLAMQSDRHIARFTDRAALERVLATERDPLFVRSLGGR